MDLPLVSAIIPVLNGERFLAAAVASIRRQRYPRIAVIVVDDGSTDGTAALARRAATQACDDRDDPPG
jgi:glycosyltransferase involved in cell wall biosynthesis